MRMKYLLPLPVCLAVMGGLAGCSHHRPAEDEASKPDPSGMVNPKCNPATVVNPDFLKSEGPDLPGAGGASGRRCRN